ncbi:sugar-phosphatase [Limosilactobacillus sp.]|jgi:Cof subfamily protein (haloacid dehalogenase superfamily)|uniref:sugar-phosphatase n=1 Tax=Limosilactobacillus sp. TaxID=2773925 RepID=UPI0025C0BC75|nr:sugar-phosphatase [Limosilactobacillus sp.]MCH3921996.1 sugar-phosphatase [Limosilactobacillus sp.]MCH3928767.1 sugar-phosphatase [Limosilactobacillus sp.]
MAIKLIAIDIDGTLINDHQQITPKTVAALKKASAEGVKVVLCTGRPMTGVEAYLEQLGLDDQDQEYVISFNGALAQSTSGNVLVNYSLSFADYADWVNFCLKAGVHSQIETRDFIYTTDQNISHYTVYESALVSMDVRYRTMDQMARDRDHYVVAKAMMVDSKEKIDHAITLMPADFKTRFSIVRSEDFYLEFMHKNASKGQTLEQLGKELNIKQDEIMALGNAQNDNSMIEYAGLGVAMGNSVPETLKIADVTVADNNHDGVAEAVEKYVFNA